MITGQFLDVSVQARGESPTSTQAMTVLRYKSAKYSVERPLHVGAALAGGAAPTLGAADARSGCRSARRSSCATTCSASSATRPSPASRPGDDLIEGKRTVLVALALDGAPAEDAERLDAALGTRADRSTRWTELRRIIDESGAHAQVERRIDRAHRRSRWPRSTRRRSATDGPRRAPRAGRGGDPARGRSP